MVLAKSKFIFLNERSFFTFFALLTCLDHIPFELLLFGPTRYEISEKKGGGQPFFCFFVFLFRYCRSKFLKKQKKNKKKT